MVVSRSGLEQPPLSQDTYPWLVYPLPHTRAFYSAQTMVNNLGFTLTPDSMVTFRDATWPMLVLTFLAFAGETFYPVFLRLVIWTLSKLVPRHSSTQESLRFLLDHPRRCYMLLFPSRPTWILFGILVALNAVDVLLIIVLDLDNPAVNDLPLGPRILSALFQAASARHTGTATLNLAAVNPAVQFSLVVMMYISIFPIAISIRASNTYEERALGLYRDEVRSLDERDGKSYVVTHIRNQLSFDLWYIFLGTFCICVAEAKRIAIVEDPVGDPLPPNRFCDSVSEDRPAHFFVATGILRILGHVRGRVGIVSIFLFPSLLLHFAIPSSPSYLTIPPPFVQGSPPDRKN